MAPTLIQKKVYSVADRAALIDGEQFIVNDKPAPFVARITLNRPEVSNQMNQEMRAQLFNQLQLNDQDPDIRCTIIRGAGDNFCTGYDLVGQKKALPSFTNEMDGQMPRNALENWFMIMDLGKPVIAQVQGECLAGGCELAASCDLVYVAQDAKIGYPEVRNMGLPDMQYYPWLCGMRNAMEIMLTSEIMTGTAAFDKGWATATVPASDLEAKVLDMAQRVAKIPADLLAYNKRSVHRAFEAQGMRFNLRTATDLEALMFHSPSATMLTKRQARGKRAPAARPTVRPTAKPAAKPTTRPAPRPVAVAAAIPTARQTARPAAANGRKISAPGVAASGVQAVGAAPVVSATKTSIKLPKKLAVPKKPIGAPKTLAAAKKPVEVPTKVAAAKNPSMSVAANGAIIKQPAVSNLKSTAAEGVHIHLHEAVNIHIHHSDDLKSKL